MTTIPTAMRVTDQAAFILRRREWQNSSLILELFTRDHGCIRVLAKGARRNPAQSPFQPFALLRVGWSGVQALKTLTSIEGQALPVDTRNYLALLYVNELVAKLLPEQEVNQAIFASYLNLLKAASLQVNEAMLRRFELDLVQRLGFFPDIGVDAETGQGLRADAYYQFQINNGFVTCGETDSNVIRGQAVIDWQAEMYQKPEVLRLAKSVLRSTIDYNLHGRILKTREVYLEMMAQK